MPLDIEHTELDGVFLLKPRRFGDARGWFSETWNATAAAEAGIKALFVQDNHSFSAQQGTLRGLHYQAPPHAQDKLIRCSRGEIFDVAVDIRRGSPGYGRWTGRHLSAESGHQLFVPKGFLHGFVTLTPECEVQYKCSDIYAPDCEGAVRWDDVDLGIKWGVDFSKQDGPHLSAKDAIAPALAQLVSPFTYGGLL